MLTAYPDQLRALLRACDEYRNGELDLDALKSAIWQTAQVVVSVEEAKFRRYLQSVEGKLDMLQVTREDVRASSLKLIGDLEISLRGQLEYRCTFDDRTS